MKCPICDREMARVDETIYVCWHCLEFVDTEEEMARFLEEYGTSPEELDDLADLEPLFGDFDV